VVVVVVTIYFKKNAGRGSSPLLAAVYLFLTVHEAMVHRSPLFRLHLSTQSIHTNFA